MPTPRRTRSPRRQFDAGSGDRRGATLLGVAIIAIVAIALSFIAWFYSSQKSALVELNSTDLCPKDATATPPAIYVVLVDQTDPLNELQRKSVGNEVLGLVQGELERDRDDTSMRHARVEVWTFSDRKEDAYRVNDVQLSLSQVLSVCNPGGAAKWDYLYKNVDVVKRQHTRFYQSFRNVLETNLNFPEAKQSPIIEAIYGIGAKVFSSPNLKDSRKRLVIVSDLVQNTRSISFFSGAKPNFDAWRKTNMARQVMPNLQGVSVTALVIPGVAPTLQTADFARFWIELFVASGAVSTGNDWLRKIQ